MRDAGRKARGAGRDGRSCCGLRHVRKGWTPQCQGPGTPLPASSMRPSRRCPGTLQAFNQQASYRALPVCQALRDECWRSRETKTPPASRSAYSIETAMCVPHRDSVSERKYRKTSCCSVVSVTPRTTLFLAKVREGFAISFSSGLRQTQSLEEKLKNSLDSELLLNILQKTVLHPLCVKHPPSVKYTRCFLSELIKKHEAAHTEPLDELYEALAEILSAEESAQCHRSYLLPSGNSVSLSESTAIISQGTTGLVTWDAALYLAEWAIENPATFTNRTVLELGSGVGFTGLAICKMCPPKAYIFSDCHSQVLQQLRGNILLNGFLLTPNATAPLQPSFSTLVSPKLTVMAVQLDWDLVTTEQLSVFQPDVIIAADVLYDPEIILSLIGVLQMLSACQTEQKAPEVYIAFTIRNPDTYQLFKMELSRVGIGWQKIPSHNQKLFPYENHSEMVILRLLV